MLCFSKSPQPVLAETLLVHKALSKEGKNAKLSY